ncbi:Fur family transcriptional regulator [Sphingobacterium hungaricum]|uniref:Fur family transcriptional regulator n=1 Tax=Sphingobacterium hungaricum TaxID=2082723 RepID=A0A928UWE9_9SPHI|nr:transcriptional repressor [Sphingobacterium hungaricum]MBE8714556.1 Fur family transcriptional regulator [Sphingobacterium hungaricum]
MNKTESTPDFSGVLRENKLKVTQPRLRVLDLINAKQTAISQPELEKVVGTEIDRVTLYRILANFEEKGILHKIFDLNGTATYALCSTNCSQDHHHDQHAHFICSSCNSIFCLEEISLPTIKIPSNFKLQEVAVNAVGLCDKCENLD